MNRFILLPIAILVFIAGFSLLSATAQPETPLFGDQGVTGGLSVADYLEWEDLGTLPAASGYTEGQTVRVGSSIYMMYAGAWVEWIDFADSSSVDESTSGTAATTIYIVTDTLTIDELSYEFLLGIESKRFVAGTPQVYIDDINVTPQARTLPGTGLDADGRTDHRGFDLRFTDPVEYPRTVRIYYALESFTGIEFSVTAGSGVGGLALQNIDIKLNAIGGIRSY